MNATLLDVLLQDQTSHTEVTYGPFTMLVDPATGESCLEDQNIVHEVWGSASCEEDCFHITVVRTEDRADAEDTQVSFFYHYDYQMEEGRTVESRPVRHAGPALDLVIISLMVKQVLSLPMPDTVQKRTLQ